MTVISRRVMTPTVGKTDLARERVNRMVAILTRSGATTRALKVVMGDGVGNIEVLGRYPNFATGSKAAMAIAADPDRIELLAEREKNQTGILQGPYVYRDIYGEVSRQPVMLFREYQISRQNLKLAIELLPEVKAAMHASTGLLAVVPVFAPVMDRLGVSYYFDSLEDMGEKMDSHAMSPAFQEIVAKASQYGTLLNSIVRIAI
jgi:hypothetical protein